MSAHSNLDWDYQRIASNVKRWSFESKMLMASMESAKLVDLRSRNPNILREMALPDEIETFVMLAIKQGEWQHGTMTLKEMRRVITGIRAFEHPKLVYRTGKDFSKWIIMEIAATQFPYQTNQFFVLNRYLEYFTYVDDNIDMRKVFKDKFLVNYEDIAFPVLLLWLSLIPQFDLQYTHERLQKLYVTYETSFDLLTLSRDEYIKELDDITTDVADYRYCLRPSYSWPFVTYNGVRYLPLPHLLVRSVTVSLMHRLTLVDNDIRERIGKYVLEPYLFKLISSSEEFDEVLPEQVYWLGKKEQRTLDVMARVGSDILCFDSKSLTPRIDIRIFSEEAYEKTKQKEVKAIIQAYLHIHDKFGSEYSYLSVPVEADRLNIIALIIVSDNPYAPLEELYEKAAHELKIPIPSPEYDWLRGHVGIVELDLLEVQLFLRESIMDTVKQNMKSGRYSDSWFMEGKGRQGEIFPANLRAALSEYIKKIDERILPVKLQGRTS